MPDTDIRTVADDYWEILLEARPTYASFIGDRRYDDRIEDLTEQREQQLRADLAGIRSRAEAVDAEGLDQSDRVTRGLIVNDTSNSIAAIDAGLTELECDQMQGIHAGLLQLAPQIGAPEPENALKLQARYAQVGELLDEAVARFRAGVDRGRPPARVNVDRSINQIEEYLESPMESDPFTIMPAPPDWDGEDAWRNDLRALAGDVIRPAMRRYLEFFRDELRPAARPDAECGLEWIDGGDEIYRTLIGIHTSTDLSAHEIHEIGLAEINERLPGEYREVGGRLFGLTDLESIFEKLRTDADLRYGSGAEIMADAEASLAKAKAAMGKWFGRLPEIDCDIKEVPEYLAADAPAAYYFPPAGDGSRPGTYFVNTHNPSEKNRFEAESIGFHEAIPGHHLQIAIATELPGVPEFQRYSLGNTAYVEGWGLYAERLADEMGLYSDDLARIGMLTADSWRAGRLVVDTGLHAKGWSRDRAIDFLADNTPLDREEITVEIDRYIGMPGQALAYKIGQREIFRLRDRARDRLDGRFDIRAFHDAVLGSGSVSLPILGELVDDYIAGAGA